ncbi:MAG: restriction endonuclease subunit S [Lachnospiraceae bacterium]|nr:restriction endonuclease subunit S [Lachnospiraceae bacterium]
MINTGKFAEFYVDVTKEGTKIPQDQYLEEGKYPVIDQGRQNIAGRWDNDEGLFTNVPAIIFGDHTRAVKYITEPFFIGADGVKILRPAKAEDNPKYLYYALQAARIPNLGYSRHFKVVKDLEIRTYSRAVQDKIVVLLEKIDLLIEQYNTEMSWIDQLVRSRFIEMFGDSVNNPLGLPTVLLSDVSDIVSGITKGRKTNGAELFEVPYMAVSNVKAGYIDWSTVKTIRATKDEIEQYCLQPLDVLMTEGGDPDKLGRGAIISAPPENCIHQNHIFRVRVNRNRLLPQYLEEYLQHQKAKQYFLGCAKQTTGIASINMKQLRVMPVLLPEIKLQNQFAAFVQATDKSKLAIQKSLNELEILKKSLMQQYFG